MPGKDVATLELAAYSAEAGEASFNVHDEDKGDKIEFSKWVAVIGYDQDGVVASMSFAAVTWALVGTEASDDGVCNVKLNIGPGKNPVRFEAYVWLYPSTHERRSNTVEFEA